MNEIVDKILVIAFKNLIGYYKSLNISDYLFLCFIYIFISWNGIQFLMNPKHLLLIISDYFFINKYLYLMTNKTTFTPLFIYIMVSSFSFYCFVKVYLEINFHYKQNKIECSFSNIINHFVSFCVPVIFYNIAFLFIFLIPIMILFCGYLYLQRLGLFHDIDIYYLSMCLTIFFIYSIIFINMCFQDFILPVLADGNSFTFYLKKLIFYFIKNKLNILFFYTMKICFIGISMVLYLYLIILAFKKPLFDFPFYDCFTNDVYMTFIIIAVMLTLNIIYSFFIQFFCLYCRKVKVLLFAEFFQIIQKLRLD